MKTGVAADSGAEPLDHSPTRTLSASEVDRGLRVSIVEGGFAMVYATLGGGMFLTGLLNVGAAGPGMSDRVMRRADRMGIWGAGLLGAAFALSFCPTSAALFFGSLLPLTVRAGSVVVLPRLYGIGTALPVVLFAVLIATGAHRIAAAFDRITQFESWARRITGAVFIGAGIFIALRYIFHVV